MDTEQVKMSKNNKTRISLKNYFIFNSTFCNKESEDDKKILFFHPEVEGNEKLKDVGFIEALIKFTGSFSFEQTSTTDVFHMKTSKTMKLFFEPEPDFWIVLTVNNPFERKENDEKEYLSDEISESVFKKIIQLSYFHFRFFNNTFKSNMIAGDELDEKIQSLRSKLENFYTRYLLTLNLHNADIIDSTSGLQMKPVTHLIFFRIVNFINMVTSMKNLGIRKCVFLYNREVVVSSDLHPMDLYVLNEYLNDSLYPKFIQRRNSQSFDDRSAGSFIFEQDTDRLDNAPRVYLRNNSDMKAYRLVIYHQLDVSLVMFVDDNPEVLNDEFSSEIKYSIAPQLSLISKEISDSCLQFSKNPPADGVAQEKYIFFNHKTNRFHACFYEPDSVVSHREGRKKQISSSVMNLLCDIYAKEESEDRNKGSLIGTEKETIIKTFNDFWLCCKSYNNRSLYLIIHKSSTLIDIAEEAQRMLSEIVKNVYFTNQQ